MSTTLVCPLDHLGLIRVSGPDARDFLQGQFSNDITQVSPAQTQLSSYSNPKGRILAVLRIFEYGDALYLQLPRKLVADTLARLRMYVLHAKVQLADASGELPGLGVSGDTAPNWLQSAGLPVSAAVDSAVAFAHGSVFRVPGATLRFVIHATQAVLNDCLAMPHQHGDSLAWRLQEIRAGLPAVYPETRELFIAQMLNLDTLGAINFKKGCYTGQEIIARLHYRGKTKQRLHRVHLATSTPPAPGTPLFLAQPVTDNPQSIGHLVDALPDAEGCLGLAVLQESSLTEPLAAGSPEGISISLLD